MPITFLVPQTGAELVFNDMPQAVTTMENNFKYRDDAVRYDHKTDTHNVATFAYYDRDGKLIFFAKQKP